MSALLLSALAAGSSGQGALYVDDVFSTYLYTGNGSTKTINNGIDLAGKGGMVWVKARSGPWAGDATFGKHTLCDSLRGTASLASNNTDAEQAFSGFSLTSSGFSVPSTTKLNDSSSTYASWSFRRAPKFFDAVTYTGNGVTGRQIAHGLGAHAGFVTVKATSTTGDWNSYHRSATGDLKLNLTDAQTASRAIITAADANTFTVSSAANANGVSYVAYLWAHNPSAEGVIQCGSFTTDGSGNATVNSGWANGSQFAMIKAASTAGDWEMYDTARTSAWSGNDARLRANLSNAEDSVARISASGTSITFAGLSANSTYIYMAIRSPS